MGVFSPVPPRVRWALPLGDYKVFVPLVCLWCLHLPFTLFQCLLVYVGASPVLGWTFPLVLVRLHLLGGPCFGGMGL